MWLPKFEKGKTCETATVGPLHRAMDIRFILKTGNISKAAYTVAENNTPLFFLNII